MRHKFTRQHCRTVVRYSAVALAAASACAIAAILHSAKNQSTEVTPAAVGSPLAARVDGRFQRDKKTAVTVRCDLGYIPPSGYHNCEFAVANDADVPWTTRNVASACRCTMVTLSSPQIAPHETGRFTVRYHAPSKTSDDVRKIKLEFAEAAAPPAELIITARVREPLTVIPREVSISSASSGSKAAVTTVYNFSGNHWDDIGILCEASCLKVEREALNISAFNIPSLRQAWTLRIRQAPANGTQLPDSAMVRLSSAPGAKNIGMLSVRLDKSLGVRVSPASMHFGKLAPGVTEERCVVVHLPEAIVKGPTHTELAAVRHNVGPSLTLGCTTKGRGVYLLTGVFSAPDRGGVVEERIIFEHPALAEPISIPFFAKVAEHGRD